MEQRFFAIEKIWVFFMLPILSLISGIITLIFQEWYGAVACFVLFFVFLLILFIGRELFFAKISISLNGISKVFGKKNIINITLEQLI